LERVVSEGSARGREAWGEFVDCTLFGRKHAGEGGALHITSRYTGYTQTHERARVRAKSDTHKRRVTSSCAVISAAWMRNGASFASSSSSSARCESRRSCSCQPHTAAATHTCTDRETSTGPLAPLPPLLAASEPCPLPAAAPSSPPPAAPFSPAASAASGGNNCVSSIKTQEVAGGKWWRCRCWRVSSCRARPPPIHRPSALPPRA